MERNHDLSDVMDGLDRIESALTAPKPVDWHAVARDAAVALWSHPEATNVKKTCDAALELVAEMRKRDGFGGQP